MSNDLDSPAGSSAAPPKRKMFGSKFSTVRLAADAVERQSRITLMAWNRLGPDDARAFLNTYSASLGGRPLDLAVASAEGFLAVEAQMAAGAPARESP